MITIMIMTATIMYCYYDDEHEGAGCHTHPVSSLGSKYLIRVHIIYLEPKRPLFLKVDPPKKQGQNSNQNKGHLGSRYLYIYIYRL